MSTDFKTFLCLVFLIDLGILITPIIWCKIFKWKFRKGLALLCLELQSCGSKNTTFYILAFKVNEVGSR